jgi:hypothetical protein
VCTGGSDEDGDGLVDCADPNCGGVTCGPDGLVCFAGRCACPGGTSETDCDDDYDNDCDGLVDCQDPDCASIPPC